MEISCSVCFYSRNSRNRRMEYCEDCCNDDSDMYAKFEPKEITDKLKTAQITIDTLVTAIEKHKEDWVTTEDNAKIYMRTYPNCATTKLWKVLEELQ